MRKIYWFILIIFTNLVIWKNKLLKNYFNPESEEAKALYKEILHKISEEYPGIEKDIVFKVSSEIKCSEIEYGKEVYNMLIGGFLIYRKKLSKLFIYSPVFNLLGYEKNNYIFIVAHEIFHVVHIVYYKEDCLSCSTEEREIFANNKAIEFLENYLPGISLEKYNRTYKDSKKIIFWHKLINNYAP